MSDVLTNVQTMVEKYGRESVPDPAITFSLSNDVRYGANFYAFQKNFEGPFEFDIFFDAGDMPGHLDSTPPYIFLGQVYHHVDSRA